MFENSFLHMSYQMSKTVATGINGGGVTNMAAISMAPSSCSDDRPKEYEIQVRLLGLIGLSQLLKTMFLSRLWTCLCHKKTEMTSVSYISAWTLETVYNRCIMSKKSRLDQLLRALTK